MQTVTLELPEPLAQELKNADEARLRAIFEWGFAGPPSPSHPYIARIPGVLGGRPIIRGTRIPVWQIANAILHLGESIENYRADHPTLTLAQIHAALSYYFDHEAEIEAEIEANRIERLKNDFDLTVDNRGFVKIQAQHG
ncbi:DUF433 domain-containing protein [candidate division KSB1 bacterium]|nr:DUF433 domain-containing protein [candidate division KSB1 bacterium]